ncbi:MAG: hypothetical protein CMK74_12335 [Pseudomonadales bacterium]|nr:hypothetical protein [Pseudomonadales bacterium]
MARDLRPDRPSNLRDQRAEIDQAHEAAGHVNAGAKAGAERRKWEDKCKRLFASCFHDKRLKRLFRMVQEPGPETLEFANKLLRTSALAVVIARTRIDEHLDEMPPANHTRKLRKWEVKLESLIAERHQVRLDADRIAKVSSALCTLAKVYETSNLKKTPAAVKLTGASAMRDQNTQTRPASAQDADEAVAH